MSDERQQRVRRLLDAARRIADAEDVFGKRARQVLVTTTGLSPEGVDLALRECLEVNATDAELDALVSGVTPTARAHVLLAANVFVAPLRAIALALAQAPRVAVRASRREPTMATLLFEASRGAFRLVEELAPSPGDHVWAYGSDDTLAALRGELPAGVVLHGHGNGFGVAVLDAEAGELAAAAKALARDVALFDQRGCLSPRVALVRGQPEGAQSFARALAAGLAELQHDVPRGALSNSEASDLTRYRDTMTYAGEVFHAGKGVVGLDLLGNVLLAPVGRNVHVTRVTDLSAALAGLGDAVAAVGISGPLADVARKALPGARQSPLGAMQTPPLDGPVDRRPSAEGEVL
ncbi:MAG: proline dehydrogenase [Myxococcales bacterium]|nr:proline dehydrogenase [Myxococcales bacterium]MCB9579487.1 proline dehydrogenase [Polyangiaceae bacterium]